MMMVFSNTDDDDAADLDCVDNETMWETIWELFQMGLIFPLFLLLLWCFFFLFFLKGDVKTDWQMNFVFREQTGDDDDIGLCVRLHGEWKKGKAVSLKMCNGGGWLEKAIKRGRQ